MTGRTSAKGKSGIGRECPVAKLRCSNLYFPFSYPSLQSSLHSCCCYVLACTPSGILILASMPDVQSKLLPPDLMAQLERLELVTRKVFRGRMKGERRSKRKGQSVEFADFRQYAPGDDLRTLDWNLYARPDKLITKLFLE